MRIARPMGLSQDGRSLIVATPTGEELAVPVDDRLHAALRGDQPRLGQLEIEMENSLTPRDIQSRIRSGQSLEEVARVAGLPADRVERFAAPVLAEREHVALTAMSASVRRRGETSGHRLLRLAVTERLAQRGLDIDSVDWDAYRRDDGRWSVSASYSSGESSRQAQFVFDPQGRFSVADNDEARWLLGEQSAAKGPQPGRRRASTGEGEADTEPTLDLSDELALVRVIQPPPEPMDAESEPDQVDEAADESEAGTQPDERDSAPAPVRALYSVPDRTDEQETEPSAPTDSDDSDELDSEETSGGRDDEESALDTLSAMLDAQDAGPSGYGGLSDASAVPETDNRGWEPAIVVDYPVEPSPETPDPEEQPDDAAGPTATAEPAAKAKDEQAGREHRTGEQAADEEAAPRGSATVTSEAAPEPAAEPKPEGAEPQSLESQEPGSPEPATRPVGKRKRAAVPSWDEIMFGGPPRKR